MTAKGKIQAKKIGYRLQNERYDLVAVSDLHRTRQTFAEITSIQGDVHTEAKGNLIFDARLREKCGGELEGMPLKTFANNAEKSGLGLRFYAPKNGERWQDVMNRAENFLNEMADRFIPK